MPVPTSRSIHAWRTRFNEDPIEILPSGPTSARTDMISFSLNMVSASHRAAPVARSNENGQPLPEPRIRPCVRSDCLFGVSVVLAVACISLRRRIIATGQPLESKSAIGGRLSPAVDFQTHVRVQ